MRFGLGLDSWMCPYLVSAAGLTLGRGDHDA